MKYLLDTNVCIRIINGRSQSARARLLNESATDVIVCSIVRLSKSILTQTFYTNLIIASHHTR